MELVSSVYDPSKYTGKTEKKFKDKVSFYTLKIYLTCVVTDSAFLLHIRKIQNSNLRWETGDTDYNFSLFSSVSSRKIILSKLTPNSFTI
jgi:hypothetical protein